jgi:hypothetical protein
MSVPHPISKEYIDKILMGSGLVGLAVVFALIWLKRIDVPPQN